MIQNYEAIAQDQLIPSSAAGKVRVRYPRGAQSLLSVDTDGHIYVADDPNADGAYQWAVVLKTGNLLFLADRSSSVGTIVLGADLKPLS